MAKIQFFKKIAQIVTGWGILSFINWVFDGPLWITVIAWLGMVKGSIVMTIAAAIMNFTLLVFYQWMGRDWLSLNGYDVLKKKGDKFAQKIQNHDNFIIRTILWVPAYFFRLLVWALKKNDRLAFVVLSTQLDSFFTTAFLRGKVGGKLTRKDYKIFIGSTALSCFYWSLRNGVILAILKGGWEVTKQFI